MTYENFQCKYCSHHSTITDPDKYNRWFYIDINESELGPVGFKLKAITCPNQHCKKLTLLVFLTSAVEKDDKWKSKKKLKEWQLLPESEAIVLPHYVPVTIQQDYYEACRIRDLSPKASATLARRCLQGMIRDFWGVSEGNLSAAINAIKDKVDPNVYEAIDAVRIVGNIGAHMEKDINMIIDVEPNEAQLLIQLIEDLIKEWYVAMKNREDSLTKISELAILKMDQKKNLKSETHEPIL